MNVPTGLSEANELYQRVQQIKPVAVINGVAVVEFSEQRDLATAEAVGGSGKLETLQMNPDGSVARTPVKHAAVNLDFYYINRYKKVKNSLYIVTDFRAIQEQQKDGVIYAKQLLAYVVTRDEATKALKLDKTVMISDAEFVSDYTHILNREAMAQIVPLLANGVGVTADDLGI